MKPWTKALLAGIALLMLIALLLPFLIGVDRYRAALEARLTAALGRGVKLGELRLSILSRGLVAKDLSIAEDPSYGIEPFFTAQQLRVGVNVAPLIFGGQLKIRSFAAIAPHIRLVRGANGSWNFSTIGNSAEGSRLKLPVSASALELSVDRIDIEEGSAVVDTLPANGPALHYDHLNVSVRNFSLGEAFPFSVSASLPGAADLRVEGVAGPINIQNDAATPVEAQITARNLNPVLAGFLDPKAGVGFAADVDARAKYDGQTATVTGKLHLDRLQLRPNASPAPNAVDVNFTVAQNLKDFSGLVQDAAVNTGNVAIHMYGSYQIAGEDPQLKFNVQGQDAPVDELQALLTAAGVRPPNRSTLRGGTLTTSLDIAGPADNLVITGPVEVTDTKLVGFDIGSKIYGVAAMSGVKTGDTTEFEKLRFDVRAANSGVQVNHLYAVIAGIGEMTGRGSISPKSELDFHLTVNVKNAEGIGKMGVGLMTKLNQAAPSSKNAPKGGGVPMTVKGTASDPVITADVSGVLNRNVKSILHMGSKH
jgi:AsmA protein